MVCENSKLRRALEEKHNDNKDTTANINITTLQHLVSVTGSKLVQVNQEAKKYNEQHNCTIELKN